MASSIFKYLSNLKDKGNLLCQLEEVSSNDNPLITGKIVQVYPLVKKSKFQQQDILVFHLKEVYAVSSRSRLVFKAVFVGQAAKLVSILNLCIGDHLAFFDTKLFSDASYTRSFSLYPKQLIIGLPHANSVDHLYYKRKNSERWCLVNPSQCADPVRPPPSVCPDSVRPEPNVSDIPARLASNVCDDPVRLASNVCDAPGRPEPNVSDISAKPSPNICDDPVRPASNVCDAPARPEPYVSHIPARPASNFFDIPARRAHNFCFDLVNHDRTDKISSSSSATSKSDNERSNAIVNNLYRYVKLAEVKKNSKVNVYVIIRGFRKNITEFSSIRGNKYHCIIDVADETKTDDFSVHIFAKNKDEFPRMKPCDIIRLHRLQIEEYNGQLDGRVFSGRDVLVFDKDTNTIYKTSKNYSWSESDRERVDELKEWMLLSDFKPRSTFCTFDKLQLKDQQINLRGQIVRVKVFKDHPAAILRIRDGTKCTVPFFRLSFTVECWTDVHSNGKAHHSESEEIDIMVSEPAGNFKTLKVDERIELFNVQVLIHTEYVKTVSSDHLRFHMKGDCDNLKRTSLKRTDSRSAESTLLKSLRSEEIPRKRRLFNPDVSSITFEDDDFEVNNVYDEHRNDIARHYNDSQKERGNVANVVDKNSKPSTSKTVDEENNQNDRLVSKEKNFANNVDAENQKQASNGRDNQNYRFINKEKNVANVDAENPNQSISKAMNEVNNQNDKDKNINNNENNEEESTSKAQCCIADQNAPVIHKENNINLDKENETVSTSEVQHVANQNDVIISTENNDLTSNKENLSGIENCERISTPCESSNQNNEDFSPKWPTNPPYKPFKVKVHILTTTPSIDESSTDDDVLKLLHHFCDSCRNVYNQNQLMWNLKDENNPIPLCPKCENDHMDEFLRLEMLVTENSKGIPIVIMGKYAEEFLGCTVDDFRMVKEKRCKVKNLIDSYLYRIWRPAVSHIFKIIPIEVHTNVSKSEYPEYHVIGVENLDC